MTRAAPAKYDVRSYWDRVARRIEARGGANVVAGDDAPFYRYRRQKFLRRFLHTIAFDGEDVLEVGCGPGGNLMEILAHHEPARLVGVDVSGAMLGLARANLPAEVALREVDGTRLPFADREFDVTFTATVLHHDTDEAAFGAVLAEICRVTSRSVILMEDTSPRRIDKYSMVLRPPSDYERACRAHGFALARVEHLETRASLFAHRVLVKGWQWGLGGSKEEGASLPRPLAAAMRLAQAMTWRLDDVLGERVGLTKMAFVRER